MRLFTKLVLAKGGDTLPFGSDIAIFVLKGDVKHQLTFQAGKATVSLAETDGSLLLG